jgi:SAM-dependent methyltransferase
VEDEKDYILGTHDEELERLGLQHRVWRPYVLDCWARAGITVGKRVIDLGAGPGYAAMDLAEIVGRTGRVVAVERSHKFVSAMKQVAQARGLTNLQTHELDLMNDDLPREQFDFSWCRWVAAFVSDPALLINKLSGVLAPGTVAVFHEYSHYDTWRYYPSLSQHERFRHHVVETWRESGGEPNAGPIVLALLKQQGFEIRSLQPLIFCIRPKDYMWQWPAEFIDVYLPRLREMGRIDERFEQTFRAELERAEKDDAVMITPLVLQIVSVKS